MARLSRVYNENSTTATYLVKEEFDEFRLDQFIMQFTTAMSREFIKSKIKKGEIYIEGRTPCPHRPSTKVKRRDHVKMVTYRSHHEDEYFRGEKVKLCHDPEVVYEDDNMIIISKPPFMSSHQTGKHLFNCANVILEAKLKSSIYGIHRIDRETSGTLAFAKNPQTATFLINKFENKQVQKAYLLIGIKKKDQLHFPIIAKERLGKKDTPHGRLFSDTFPEDSLEGKPAHTEYREIFQNKEYCIALAFPKTGRQHQIRAHASHHGFPLLGDKIYTKDPEIFSRYKDGLSTDEDFDYLQINRHALHSIMLSFKDNDQTKTYISKIPDDLLSWIDSQLKIDTGEIQDKIKMTINRFLEEN